MKLIPNKSIDAIICDLPYGATNCKWDSVIDLALLWEQYNRIIKDSGAIVLMWWNCLGITPNGILLCAVPVVTLTDLIIKTI